MSGESIMFETETGLMNYRHDKCMSGESKMFRIETGLMNYWQDRCMSSESKILNTEMGLWIISMLGACRVEVKC